MVPVESIERLETAQRREARAPREVAHVALALLEGHEPLARLHGRGARLCALLEERTDGVRLGAEAHGPQGLNDVAWTIHVAVQCVGDDVAVSQVRAQLHVERDGPLSVAAHALADEAMAPGSCVPRARTSVTAAATVASPYRSSSVTVRAVRLPTLRPAFTQRAKRASMPGTAVRSPSCPFAARAPRLSSMRAWRCAGSSTTRRRPQHLAWRATSTSPFSTRTTASSAASARVLDLYSGGHLREPNLVLGFPDGPSGFGAFEFELRRGEE